MVSEKASSFARTCIFIVFAKGRSFTEYKIYSAFYLASAVLKLTTLGHSGD